MGIENKKRVAALVRLLSSDQQGEALSSLSALKRMCSLNDLGNFIEGLDVGNGNSLSKQQMKELYEAGYDDGRSSFKREMEQKNTQKNGSAPWEDIADIDDAIFGKTDDYKVKYCNTHKDKLKKQREKEFIDNMVNWTTVRQKPLTEPQKKWINDIYSRLGGT